VKRSLLTALAITAAAGAAHANGGATGSRFQAPLPNAGGPALAGERVVWAEKRADGSVAVRSASTSGKHRKTLLRTPANGYLQFARLTASTSTLAVEVISGDDPNGPGPFLSSWRFRDVYAGPPEGPLEPLATHCPLDENPQLPQTIDVSGHNVVYGGCDGVVVRNMTTGDATHVPANSRGLRIAGPYVAWVNGTSIGPAPSIDVYDWRKQKLVYEIPASKVSQVLADLDLRSDGTLVLTGKQKAGKRRLDWASRESPKVHAIPVARSETYFVRFVGKRVAFERGSQFNGDVPRATLGLTDLKGNTTILARGARSNWLERLFDFDGKRVAWYAYACSGARLHVQSVDARVLVRESLSRCPLRYTRKPKVKNGRKVHLFLKCYGYAAGECSGHAVTLRLDREPHSIVGEGKNSDEVTLTDEGAQMLKKESKLRVRVRLTVKDPSGTRERRSGKAKLEIPYPRGPAEQKSTSVSPKPTERPT
jgi:hypothetical protein